MVHVTEARRWKLVALASLALLIGYVAGQLAPSATAQSGENVAWEYAEVEYLEGAGIQSFIISTPDGARAIAGAAPIRDDVIEQLGLIDSQGLTPTLLVLNMLGEDGWKFAGMSRMQEDDGFAASKYLLKRRRS
jgi:hypothetical protein